MILTPLPPTLAPLLLLVIETRDYLFYFYFSIFWFPKFGKKNSKKFLQFFQIHTNFFLPQKTFKIIHYHNAKNSAWKGKYLLKPFQNHSFFLCFNFNFLLWWNFDSKSKGTWKATFYLWIMPLLEEKAAFYGPNEPLAPNCCCNCPHPQTLHILKAQAENYMNLNKECVILALAFT